MHVAKIKIIRKVKTFGQSMYPLFKDGDVIEIQKISYPKIETDDVISFYRKGKLISHRVIYKTKSHILTVGDNNTFLDKKVSRKDIIGKVIGVCRGNQNFALDSLYFYQSSIYWQEILKIKNEFDKAKIEYLFLKGLPLSLYHKKSIPKRIFADCDLLILEKDLSKAAEILSNFGYIKKRSHESFLPEFLEKGRPEYNYNKLVDKVIVSFDIHTEVAFLMKTFGSLDAIYPNYLTKELTLSFFQQKEWINLKDEKFPVLSPAQFILYLMLHIFSHNFKGYNRYELLVYVLKINRKIDFDEIAEDINKYKLNSFVYSVILLLRKYYDVSFPKNFIKKIAPEKNQIEYLKREVLKRRNPFVSEEKWERGMRRFMLVFYFSPNDFITRLLIFFQPQIIYAIFWVFVQRLKIFVDLLKNKYSSLF